MSSIDIKFNIKDKPELFKELKKRVNKYFTDNNITKYSNLSMRVKTIFMISLYFIPLIIIISGFVSSLWVMIAMWVLMGFGMSGIGLSIMHDANHGAYSKNKITNKILGYLINFLGAYHITWKIQHNVLHHSYTNVENYDGDIENPVMRFSPNQKRKKFFKYQIFYAPFLYGIMTIYWFISKDFERLVRYNKRNLLKTQGITLTKAVLEAIFNKIWYISLTLVLPIIMLEFPWWQVLIGFLFMHFICGLLLALIFQPAHVIEETEFFVVDENNSLENNWAIHQFKTTSNFAKDSKLFSWFVGGLNFQVEHHLFPNMCHIHYRKISDIVKATTKEYGIPYHQHKTFFAALKSHFTLLNKLGTGKYDKEMAKI